MSTVSTGAVSATANYVTADCSGPAAAISLQAATKRTCVANSTCLAVPLAKSQPSITYQRTSCAEEASRFTTTAFGSSPYVTFLYFVDAKASSSCNSNAFSGGYVFEASGKCLATTDLSTVFYSVKAQINSDQSVTISTFSDSACASPTAGTFGTKNNNSVTFPVIGQDVCNAIPVENGVLFSGLGVAVHVTGSASTLTSGASNNRIMLLSLIVSASLLIVV